MNDKSKYNYVILEHNKLLKFVGIESSLDKAEKVAKEYIKEELYCMDSYLRRKYGKSIIANDERFYSEVFTPDVIRCYPFYECDEEKRYVLIVETTDINRYK